MENMALYNVTVGSTVLGYLAKEFLCCALVRLILPTIGLQYIEKYDVTLLK